MRAIIIAGLLVPGLAFAQVSGTMSYQGRLLKADGTLETGAPQVTFSIYSTATGTPAMWSESQNVKLTNGFYAVQLGSVVPFPDDLFEGSARWLGVHVAGDAAELSPRQFIATVPYAFRAVRASTAEGLLPAVAGAGISANGERLRELAAPADDADAATKQYADSLVGIEIHSDFTFGGWWNGVLTQRVLRFSVGGKNYYLNVLNGYAQLPYDRQPVLGMPSLTISGLAHPTSTPMEFAFPQTNGARNLGVAKLNGSTLYYAGELPLVGYKYVFDGITWISEQ